MSTQVIEKLYVWTNGDPSVGIPGETAEVMAPGCLLSFSAKEADEYRPILDAFRKQIIEAFTIIWPNDVVEARYDFELKAENACLDESDQQRYEEVVMDRLRQQAKTQGQEPR